MSHTNQPKHQVLTYLYQAADKNKIALVLLIVMQALHSICGVLFILTMRTALDGAVKKNLADFGYGLLFMAGLVVLQIALRAMIRYFEERVRASVENNLKARMLGHLLQKDYAKVEATHTGEWMNRLTSDTVVVASGITGILPNLTGMLVKLIAALVMILIMIPAACYFLLPGGLVAILIAWVLRKAMKKHHKAVQESDGRLRTFLQERLGSMMVVRAFRAEQSVTATAEEKLAEHKDARLRKNLIANLCNIGFAAFIYGIYILSFAYCGYGIIYGGISYGTLLAVLQLVAQIQAPLSSITGFLPQFYGMTASAERLLEVEAFRQAPDTAEAQQADFAQIALQDLCFSYPGENQPMVLSELNLSFCQGDYVAFTGHSGCGKSTLFKLLLCLYQPSSGKLLLTAPDKSSRPLSVSDRGLFGYVPQGNHLMSGSVRDVVTFSKEEDTDEVRIWQALRIACADTFVLELENGLDTLLGERGAGLSEGQLQRLAIARAIYADTKILLLDEATSSLDEATEKQVLLNLQAMTDKTVLIVTHRPAALSICNRILKFTENGITE